MDRYFLTKLQKEELFQIRRANPDWSTTLVLGWAITNFKKQFSEKFITKTLTEMKSASHGVDDHQQNKLQQSDLVTAVTEEHEILGLELASALATKDAEVKAAADEANLAATMHQMYDMFERRMETKFAEMKRGLFSDVMAEVNATIEARLAEVAQTTIQDKCDDASLKRELADDIAKSVISQVEDQVNSCMGTLVRRKVKEEITKQDLASESDIVGRVQVKMESRQDEMVESKIKEKYTADDIVRCVQLKVESRMDEIVGVKIKEKYAADDILLRKILDDTKLVKNQVLSSSSSNRKRAVSCVESRATKPQKKPYRADGIPKGGGEPEAEVSLSDEVSEAKSEHT
ncbi:hypothetical protein PR003_g1367 [Phytophthora rubi]|uniref:Uncharacterized protein n=1 Tax=Phytophthora rubi TaxID=129364 RepID=A0A6A4FVK0_9STRA|nr:hypothetical protein PR002_g1779 [Phytophthora rubi]KAE9358288.1 hypothetical protein PR003_g1367 [Phytophthora rubi]